MTLLQFLDREVKMIIFDVIKYDLLYRLINRNAILLKKTWEENDMRNLARNTSLVFAAGCLGGLLNSLAVWIFGELGITTALGVKIAPQLSPAWLYPRLVWGGIWGLLFLLPMLSTRIWSRGLIFSLGPTLVQLFVVFPMKAHKGAMGHITVRYGFFHTRS